MSDLKIVVRVTKEEYPELFADLMSVPERARAGRLRYWASHAAKQKAVGPVSAAAVTSPAEQLEQALPTAESVESQKKAVRRPPRAREALLSLGTAGKP